MKWPVWMLGNYLTFSCPRFRLIVLREWYVQLLLLITISLSCSPRLWNLIFGAWTWSFRPMLKPTFRHEYIADLSFTTQYNTVLHFNVKFRNSHWSIFVQSSASRRKSNILSCGIIVCSLERSDARIPSFQTRDRRIKSRPWQKMSVLWSHQYSCWQ